MRFLELRIPPPAVGLIVAVGMWTIARLTPAFPMPTIVRVLLAAILGVAGIAVALGGVMSFRRARTTVNPLKPETTAALVSTGIYSITRNPMYLGMVLVLVGWAAYLSCVWSLLGPVLFALFITRFQIVPEERALTILFGESFAEYRQRVRRWV